MRRWRSSWLLLLAFGVVACGTPASPTGALSIAITGLPAGIAAAVTVSGPGAFSETVTASRVLTGLAPGSYTIATATVDDGHPIVPALYDATVATPSVDVTVNATAVGAVTHAWRAPSGMGWISLADEGDSVATLLGYAADQLASSGDPVAAVTMNYAPEYWDGIAFDGSGNAWVARFGPSDEIVRFRAADLAAGGTRTPDVVLGSSGAATWSAPVGLAFDDDGALWVAGYGSNTVVKFAPAQLTASGSPVPQVVISTHADSLIGPTGIAFDADGNLWGATLDDGVVKFAPAQIQVTGTPTPTAHLTGLGRPKTLAFDHSGDLWIVADAGLGGAESLIRIADPGSLPASSVAAPATTIGVSYDLDGGFLTFFPPAPGVPIRTP